MHIEPLRQSSVQRHTLLHPFLMAALLALLVVANFTGSVSTQFWPLVVAVAAALFCVVECRLAGFSWAHPRILIMGYVVMACSLPPAILILYPDSNFAQVFQASYRFLSPQMPLLMAFAILATGVGLSLQSYQPRVVSAPPTADLELDHDPSTIARHQFARIVLICMACVVFADGFIAGATGRGNAQTSFGFQEALVNLRNFVLLAAVVVVYSSRMQLRWSAGKAILDHVMVALAMVGYLLMGRRNPVLALLLVLFILKQSIKPTKLRNIFLAIVAGASLFSWIALYRSVDPSRQDDSLTLIGVWESFVTDLSSVSGTTGVVASQIPSVGPYTMGATLLADIVRMIPSPIAIAAFGQPTNTGSMKYREVMQYDNPDNGFGFSLPAAGYLDFGLVGLIGFMVLCGWLIAYLWRHFDPYRPDASSLTYLLIAANFAMYLRSDVLGLLKGVLYPLAIVWIIIALADQGKRLDQRRARTAKPGSSRSSATSRPNVPT